VKLLKCLRVVASAASGPTASVKQDAGVLTASPGGAAGVEAEAVTAAADGGRGQVGRPSSAAVPARPHRPGTLVQRYQPARRSGASRLLLSPLFSYRFVSSRPRAGTGA